MEIVRSQRDLFDLVRALGAAGRFAGRLDGGQQEGDEHADDGDDDEQFHECETVSRA